MNIEVNPQEDTEWNDILRKHGIIPEKPPSPSSIIEEIVADSLNLAHENRLEDKDLDELDGLEDDEDEEFLNVYRQKRMAEFAAVSTSSVYNQVYPIQKVDYQREVTEESYKAFVLVLLVSSHGTNVESRVLTEIWRDLASRLGDIKFCQIRADLCIENYPDQSTPTVLVYSGGDIVKQIITLREFNGPKTSSADFEQVLVECGAIQSNDMRIQKDSSDDQRKSKLKNIRSVTQKKQDSSDEDND